MAQEYQREELNFTEDQIQLQIRYLDFRNWAIDEPIEMHISYDCTFIQFANMINKYYPNLKVLTSNKN